jgi:hypothetical protein
MGDRLAGSAACSPTLSLRCVESVVHARAHPMTPESPREIAQELIEEGIGTRCGRHGRVECIQVPCMELRIMARALVEIDKRLEDAEDGADTVDALHAEGMWRYQCADAVECIRAILDGTSTAQEQES